MRSTRVTAFGLALAAAGTAAADVNFSLIAFERDFRVQSNTLDSRGLGLGYVFDFGARDQRWRPEVAFMSAGPILSDNGQREYAVGMSYHWGEDDAVLRISGGIEKLETFDGSLDAEVVGGYLQFDALWRPGERFSIGISGRLLESEDARAGGQLLASDYSQLGVVVSWRFGD